MARGELFSTALQQRERVRVVQEFLDWLYAVDRSPEQQVRSFWTWHAWLTPEQAAGPAREQFDRIIGATRAWRWEKLRHNWIARLNGMMNRLRLQHPGSVQGVGRSLVARAGRDGREYLAVVPVMPQPLTEENFEDLVLDEVMQYLDGLAVAAVGNCAQCGRLFFRLRAKRRLFCSTRCKYEGAPSTKRRKAGEKARRAQRRASAGGKR